MQYHPPSGSTDPNAPYVGKNVAAGTLGSKVPPGAAEYPQREIVNTIALSGQTPADTDQNQLARAIRGGQLDFDATDTGTADAVVCQVGLAHSAIAAGLPFTFIKGPNANTGNAVPTLTITDLAGNNALTGTIVKAGGGALAKGDLPANALTTVRARAAGVFAVVSLVVLSDTVQTVLNVQRTQIVADRGASVQSVPDSTFTSITNYGNVTVKTQGGSTFVNGLLTVGSGDAGLWFVSFHARQSITGASGFSNGLFINGSATPIITGGANAAASGATVHGTGARLLNLNAGDTVVVKLIQTTGSTVTFNDIYDFSAVRLGSS